MHMDDMFSYFQWLDSKGCRAPRQVGGGGSSSLGILMKPLPSRSQARTLKVTRLQRPFLKIEDESRRLCPFLQQFKNFPELCFPEGRRHSSPFDSPRSPASSKTPEGQLAHSGSSSDCCLLPKRQRGYCECCEETFLELQMHLHSPRHRAFVLDASHYAPVDNLISQMNNIFAGPSCSPLPLRVPPAISDDRSGFREDILQSLPTSSGPPPRSCLSGESSAGCSVRSTPTAEDQSLPAEMLNTPALLLTSQPLSDQAGGSGSSSGAEHHGRGGADAGALLKPAASLRAGSWTAPQQAIRGDPAAPLPPQPRKRKLSYSPSGQVKKRPALTRQLLPDVHPGIPPAGPTEGSFSQERGSQSGPGGLQLSAVPAAKPQHCLHAPTQLPPEGSARPPRDCALTGTGQQPERKEGGAVLPSEEGRTQALHKSPIADAKLVAPDIPSATCPSSQLPDSGARPRSPGVGPSQFLEAVGPEWPGLGLPPLVCSAEPSSSESEWDRSLLCALEGTSRVPFEHPIDSALLGTRVRVQDSGYESHLCAVLWQTLEPREARQGDSSGCHGHKEVLRTPFGSLDRLGPLFRNEPAPPF
ncbi:protein DBF4 homolog B [Heteronotia binoei]|uniref:protein DBF4 homolog B n=1 Tax=Heteronotia binoei TaxID=13085 RepID=UPI00292DEEC9|nr:protein DBF4 homolog B [Heteronotia binoei]